MLDRVADFEQRGLDLGLLVRDLRGLFIEADPHDASIRSDFESKWSPIDAEYELRTESWAPAGAASDGNLANVLGRFRSWVEAVLAADTSSEHC